MSNKEDESGPPEEKYDKFMDLGGGFKIVPDEKASGENTTTHPSQQKTPRFSDDEEEARDRDINREYDYLLNDDNKKTYLDEPCYADQYARYPETVRRVGPMIQVFNLDAPDDVHELNTLMTGAQNHSAPRSMISIMDKQWSEKTGNWKILAQVYKFKYLNILERD
jgi:hypothetical protein